MLNKGLDKLELLRIVEAVANEKSIDKELVIGSMESAIQKAALTKFGNDNNIEVVIDRESGNIKIQKVLKHENLIDGSQDQYNNLRQSAQDNYDRMIDFKDKQNQSLSFLGALYFQNTFEIFRLKKSLK